MKGYITRCNNKTEPEVLHKKIMGDLPEFMQLYQQIREEDYLFLYNFESFQFSGPYRPIGKGGTIDGKAWKGKFPAQIRFEAIKDTGKISLKEVADVIKRWNGIYPHPELSEQQVEKILAIISK